MSAEQKANGKECVYLVAQCTLSKEKSASSQKWAVACFYDSLPEALEGAVRIADQSPLHAAIVVRVSHYGCTTQVESFGLEGATQPGCAWLGLFSWPNYARSWSIWEAAARFALQTDDESDAAVMARQERVAAPEPSWLLVWRDSPVGMSYVEVGTATNDCRKARRFATREAAEHVRSQHAWMQDFEAIREDQA